MKRILLIDDQQNFCEQIQKALNLYKIPLEYETEAKKGLERSIFEQWDVVLLDVVLNQSQDGLDILKQIVEKKPYLPIIMVSGTSTLQTAVEATKMGAYDFLEKPLDVNRLRLTIKRALEKNQLAQANLSLLNEISKQFPLVGKSESIISIIAEVEQIAPSDAKVFIQGESGVGKDLLAKILHYRSHRNGKPFVSINCGAIPHNLVESELFGYEKGSFTGADKRKDGLISKAEGGTLFLDEITELPINSQAKLLHFLQDGQYSRLGSTQTIQSNVRIISATNRVIQNEIKLNNFREDLFYRLNVVSLSIPPIRNRKEDILPLSEFFLQHACKKFGKNITNFSQDALELMQEASWPGNVRQLKSAVYRMVIFAENNIIDYGTAATALQMDRTLESEVLSNTYENAVQEFEKLYLLNILNLNKWNLVKVTEQSGLSKEFLTERLEALQLKKGESDTSID